MATLYEEGWSYGWWTPELVRTCGFGSPQECLVHMEQQHQYQMSLLPGFSNRAYAARQAEWLEGCIAAARQSLGQISASDF